jgi:radical SAM superfamily enzyme YgiQ (UPF0313 family)
MTPPKGPVLLVNPNRYMAPPVIPLGIEYLAHALRQHGLEVAAVDLSFSDDPIQDLEKAVHGADPQAVCISVRNVDSVLHPETDFFLPEIRSYIEHLRTLTEAPVIIGGAGIPADPAGILRFLGADLAIDGPGEKTLPALLRDGGVLSKKGQVIQGKPPDSFCPARRTLFSYEPYLKKDGLPGFETHKGCSSHCVYCIEAGRPVRFREPSDVVSELRQLVDAGFQHLHLCDSEFNENLEYCETLLRVINQEELGLEWGLYMKPGNASPEFFELLAESGAYLVTLAVDTYRRGPAYRKEIASTVALCKVAGIRISIDLITGFPYESEAALRDVLDFFRKISPDEVVVNVFIRLYQELPLTRVIAQDPSLHELRFAPSGEKGSLVPPVFYNHVPVERLRELIQGDPRFRIAGQEKVVNYQKAKN